MPRMNWTLPLLAVSLAGAGCSSALPAASPLPAIAADTGPTAAATPRNDARGLRPREARTNGGLAILTLTAEQAAGPLFLHGQPVWIGRLPGVGSAVAVVGIPLDASGELALDTTADAKGQPALTFSVTPRTYPEQRLTLTETKYVSPAPEQLARFEREAAEQKAAYRQHVAAVADNGGAQTWPTFRWPLTGRLSSPFGLRRYFNDEPRAPHLGLDIAGATGTLVRAPASGRIALTGDYFFNGRTVIIDHGQGLFSMLCHFSEVLVRTGDSVSAGSPVGRVGATGRATGPHLHWTVSLNDARIDPRWLLPGDKP